MSLSGIRDAIKTALGGISGLTVYDTVPDKVNVNTFAYVLPLSGEYDFDAGGNMVHRFEIAVLTRSSNLPQSQDTLDAFLDATGASSVKAAVDGASLGAHGDVIRVTSYRDMADWSLAGSSTPALNLKWRL
jgi:hypothetical protein